MNEPPRNRPAERLPPLTDSPWFWLVLFGGMGLMALVAVGPKYGRRQAPIERKFQARQQIRISADRDATANGNTPPVAVEYSTAADTVVKLWPIQALVLVVTVAAAAALVRHRIAQHRACVSPSRDER